MENTVSNRSAQLSASNRRIVPMPSTFKVSDIHHIAKQVSKRVKYPIMDEATLTQGLGGRGASIPFGAETHKVEDATRHLPADLFPIESEEDFIAKAATLRARGNSSVEDAPPAQVLKDPPANMGKPPVLREDQRMPKGKSGYKGIQ
jgi:hypothetical protein